MARRWTDVVIGVIVCALLLLLAAIVFSGAALPADDSGCAGRCAVEQVRALDTSIDGGGDASDWAP